MPAIPVTNFEERLRALDHSELVGFVAALWDATGWETRVTGPVVVASNASTTDRLLILPPMWFPRFRTAPQTDEAVDRVVVPRTTADDPVLPRNTPALPVLDAADLLDRLLYSLESEEAEELVSDHLGVPLRGERWEPQESALVRARQRVSERVEPAEKHVSRRVALGTLGVSALAGGAWILQSRTGTGTDTDETPQLESESTPTADTPTTASFAITVEDEQVTVTHDGGTGIAAGQLLIQTSGLAVPRETTWSGVSTAQPEDIVSEGDSIRLEASQAFEIRVVLDRETEQEQLAQFTYGTPASHEEFDFENPFVSFIFDYDAATQELTVTHQRGDPLRAGSLSVEGVEFDAAPTYEWTDSTAYDAESPVRPSESVALTGASELVAVQVVYDESEDSRVLGQYYGPGRPRSETLAAGQSDRYGPANTGFTQDPGTGEVGSLEWEFEYPQQLGPGCAIQQGILVVAGGNGRVFALDAADGVELWRTRVRGSTGGTPVLSDSKVYLRQLSREQTGLVALDLFEGSVDWTLSLPQQQLGQPVVSGEQVYVPATGGPNASSAVYALKKADARSVWSTTVEDFRFPAYLAVADQQLYTATARGVTALNTSSGAIDWRYEAPEERQGAFWGPIVVDESVVALFRGDDRNSVVRLGRDGTKQWHTALSRPPAMLPVASPDQLFVPLEGSDIVALDLGDGTRSWRQFTTETLSAVTGAGGLVFVAEGRFIYVLDASSGDDADFLPGPGREAVTSLVAAQDRLFAISDGVGSFGPVPTGEDQEPDG